MSIQEQAAQMIYNLSDDNVIFLIDFIKKFMLPEDNSKETLSIKKSVNEANFMQEIERMRLNAKAHFPSDFDSQKIWEEAMDKKYDHID